MKKLEERLEREDDGCGEWRPRSVFAATRYRIENGEEVILGDKVLPDCELPSMREN